MLGHLWFLLNLEVEEEPNSGSAHQTDGILINPQHRPHSLKLVESRFPYFDDCGPGSTPTLDADSLELHTKLEALRVIAPGTGTSHVIHSWCEALVNFRASFGWEVFAKPQVILSEAPWCSTFITAKGDFMFYFNIFHVWDPRPVLLLLCWTSATVVAPLMTMKRQRDRSGEIWCLGHRVCIDIYHIIEYQHITYSVTLILGTGRFECLQ